MKILTFISLTAGLLFIAQAQAHADFGDNYGRPVWRDYRPHDWVDARQLHQQRRIERGIHTGQLSPSEVKKLHRKQRKIARLEHRFKRDGWLSHSEQHILDKKLNKASEQIHRLKQNDRHGRIRQSGQGYWRHPYALDRQNINREHHYSSTLGHTDFGRNAPW
jgi:hypothetical protein